MKDKITDIFFDLDHTLWDFDRNSNLTFGKILKTNRVDVLLEDFVKVYVPLNAEYWKLYREERISKEELRYGRLKDTFDRLKMKVEDELIHRLSDQYIQELPNQNYLFENTTEILDYLRPNYKLHIITNGFEEVQKGKLNNSKIGHFFTHIINSEMVGVKKPNPRIFEFALEKASVSPENTVMIGDNLEADILGAKNMGMNTLHFNSNNEEIHDHSIIINDLLEIKQYL
ncbi:noncanonical pyrimidine nucleotidase, YjjG family [Leptobacterium flavescens]|uniref:Noncanonical pyrimidine nucleotidase, YjjG family n=1 Tax=Leptobacterium flavescens TaxID=472055 RepID=A0A6P0UQB4_9FLAO|nr:YjjG family noncanonical pyrimidine nucleotidase [Leptobacterium flavescens]NER15147.1 noncanonical pyrimidine nucleotidase, YjjG family [Leptobacterium flavescens]